MSGWRHNRGAWLVGAGLTGMLSSLAVVVGTHARAGLGLRQKYFKIDPDTLEAIEWEQHGRDSILLIHHEHHATLLAIAIAGLVVCVVGLRDLGMERLLACLFGLRDRGKDRVWMTAPLWLPVLLGLLSALFATRPHSALLSSFVPFSVHPSDCMGSIDRCSHVHVTEWLRNACLLGLALAALSWVPAGRRAWLAGRDGQRLGRGWSRAAVACLVLGALALGSTRAHRSDRAKLASRCEAADWLSWGHFEAWGAQDLDWNVTSRDLEGLEIPFARCAAEPGVGPDFKLSADGMLTPIDGAKSVEDIAGQLGETKQYSSSLIAKRLDLSSAHPEPLTLYLDANIPMDRLRPVLQWFARLGVREVVLFGTSVFDDELETIGPWRRRVFCPLATIDLTQLDLTSEGFSTTFMALVEADTTASD